MSEQLEFEQVVEIYADMVYRLALARTGNQNDADDIFQEVFLRYLKNNEPFQSEEHRRAWLIRVTANCSTSFWRSAWRRKTQALREEIPLEEPEDQILYETLKKLPKRDRTVLHLFYYEEYSIKEIGHLINAKESTVRTQLTRARRKLKLLLEEEKNV